VQVSLGEEKLWIWVKRLEAMRGIRPGSEGVPIYVLSVCGRRLGGCVGTRMMVGEGGGYWEYHAVCFSTSGLSVYVLTPIIRN